MSDLAQSMLIIPHETGGFAVEIITAQAAPQLITGFASRDEAEAWILHRELTDGDDLREPHILVPANSQAVS